MCKIQQTEHWKGELIYLYFQGFIPKIKEDLGKSKNMYKFAALNKWRGSSDG